MSNKRKYFFLLVLVLSLTTFLGLSAPTRADTSVFINEIHYDNTGTDAGEAIEIAGPAGTDLTGWSIVLYNGSGGAVYNTTSLSGLIPNQQNGFGTVFVTYPSNGIQNGSPDGLALVDSGSTVVQFLSYEGTFAAVGGPADGQTSTDIGVSQSGSGAVGNSLQLTGSGNIYEDFTWAPEAASTFGAVNSGQTFIGTPTTPVLVINEVDYDQASTDTAEFVEIKNVGTSDADLSNVTIELVNGNAGGAAIYQTITLPAGTLAPGDYYVVCGNAATVANCDLDVLPDTNLVQNGAPDAVGVRYSGTLLDAVSYEGDSGAPYTEGSGVGLEDNPDAGDKSIARCADGMDTNQNNVDFVFSDRTPGAANACAAPAPDLVINEIDYDQPSTDGAEFVEIKNVGDTAADLDGVTLELVNGSGTTIYQTIILPVVSLAAGDYYVVCGNAANVANCDLDVSPDTNLVQNGAPDAVGLRFNGDLLDAVSYEGDTGAPYTEGSGTGLIDDGVAVNQSISRCEDGVDTDQNNVDFVLADSTPGAENDCGGGGEIGACGDPATFIHTIQGNGLSSPLIGQSAVIEGVVVGDFQAGDGDPFNTDLGGFYVQEEDGEADADPASSEGIFVFAPSVIDVAVGDKVRVGGEVAEFFDMTEIADVFGLALCSSGNGVALTELTLPVDSLDDLEPFEGMYVTFPQDLVIAEYFNFDRFNEIVLAEPSIDGRVFQPTAVYEPGSPEAAALADLITRSRITLDDGRSEQNPNPVYHPDGNVFDLSNLFRGGDVVQNATGVLDYRFGLYRIQPTEGADHIVQNPRPAAPENVGGNLTVASFNVLNYFLSIDTGVFNCGPAGNQECRGADTEEEFERQRAKILSALSTINADIFGLIEMENTTGVEPLQDIVDGLNAMLGAGTYAFIDTGTIGTDAIRVGIIYKPATVTPVGGFETLDSLDDPRFIDTRNRPSLAQTFQDNGGNVFTVTVNHLKSKGSDCGGPPDDDPQQGNCNGTRTLAAQALVDWLATDPTGSGDPDFLIMGDLNAYDKEDPIDAIRAGADDVLGTGDDYSDMIFEFQGEFAYSFVFDGQLGYLDHALAIQSLASQVTGVTEWHINADEPDLLDYDMTFKQDAQDALFEPNAYRSADHDPVIAGLDLNTPPNCANATPSKLTLWPANHKFVNITVLGVTDPNGDAVTITIDSIFQDEAVDAPDSGNTAPDGQGVGTATAQVRAERVGSGNGRVYHISFTASDGNGGSCSGEVLVGVPLSQGGGPPVDDGPLFDSTVIP
jgi:hypothetical protein